MASATLFIIFGSNDADAANAVIVYVDANAANASSAAIGACAAIASTITYAVRGKAGNEAKLVGTLTAASGARSRRGYRIYHGSLMTLALVKLTTLMAVVAIRRVSIIVMSLKLYSL